MKSLLELFLRPVQATLSASHSRRLLRFRLHSLLSSNIIFPSNYHFCCPQSVICLFLSVNDVSCEIFVPCSAMSQFFNRFFNPTWPTLLLRVSPQSKTSLHLVARRCSTASIFIQNNFHHRSCCPCLGRPHQFASNVEFTTGCFWLM